MKDLLKLWLGKLPKGVLVSLLILALGYIGLQIKKEIETGREQFDTMIESLDDLSKVTNETQKNVSEIKPVVNELKKDVQELKVEVSANSQILHVLKETQPENVQQIIQAVEEFKDLQLDKPVSIIPLQPVEPKYQAIENNLNEITLKLEQENEKKNSF